jgi:hypothetical protein
LRAHSYKHTHTRRRCRAAHSARGAANPAPRLATSLPPRTGAHYDTAHFCTATKNTPTRTISTLPAANVWAKAGMRACVAHGAVTAVRNVRAPFTPRACAVAGYTCNAPLSRRFTLFFCLVLRARVVSLHSLLMAASALLARSRCALARLPRARAAWRTRAACRVSHLPSLARVRAMLVWRLRCVRVRTRFKALSAPHTYACSGRARPFLGVDTWLAQRHTNRGAALRLFRRPRSLLCACAVCRVAARAARRWSLLPALPFTPRRTPAPAVQTAASRCVAACYGTCARAAEKRGAAAALLATLARNVPSSL